MATVGDLANGALYKLGAVDYDETPEAAMQAKAVAAFNGIMHEQAEAGWLGLDGNGDPIGHTTQSAGATFALAPAYDEAMKAAIAVRVGPEVQISAGPQTRLEAARFFAMLANANYAPATFERGIRFESVEDVTV